MIVYRETGAMNSSWLKSFSRSMTSEIMPIAVLWKSVCA
jgi:hypothetical protein